MMGCRGRSIHEESVSLWVYAVIAIVLVYMIVSWKKPTENMRCARTNNSAYWVEGLTDPQEKPKPKPKAAAQPKPKAGALSFRPVAQNRPSVTPSREQQKQKSAAAQQLQEIKNRRSSAAKPLVVSKLR